MLFECVPNFSEGRDPLVIDAISKAATSVRGVALLDVHRDPDHNRCVLTLAGPGDALVESVVRAAREATARIDLRSQKGEHPRIGATDVVPFVPLGKATMEDAVALATRTGERFARELGVPVYFYENAARRPERRELPKVRNVGFEELGKRAASSSEWTPDLGTAFHPSAGAACVGARFFLVAFNVDLESEDLALARRIAREVRESSGGLLCVRAKGFRLASQKRVQVSMNLVDYRVTGIGNAFLFVFKKAFDAKVAVARSELVGLVPQAALDAAAAELLKLGGFSSERCVLEKRLEAALSAAPGAIGPYLDAIAAPAHSPGGGSAAALAAAIGHACLEKAHVLSEGKGSLDTNALAQLATVMNNYARSRWFALAAEDELVFAELAATWKLDRKDPAHNARRQAAIEANVDVALRAARGAAQLAEAAARVARDGNKNLVNDAALAAELALAATRGARLNALGTRRKDAALRAELDALLARAEAAVQVARAAAEPPAT